MLLGKQWLSCHNSAQWEWLLELGLRCGCSHRQKPLALQNAAILVYLWLHASQTWSKGWSSAAVSRRRQLVGSKKAESPKLLCVYQSTCTSTDAEETEEEAEAEDWRGMGARGTKIVAERVASSSQVHLP
jgi:hypothetical protein